VRAFNVAASMLEASGMADEFEAQRGHGARRRRSASRATPRPQQPAVVPHPRQGRAPRLQLSLLLKSMKWRKKH
jgi:hypothetical protein